MVRGANKAFIQSALEKKSASILKDPQSVQIKGNAAIINQRTINVDIEILRDIGSFKELFIILRSFH